MLDYGKALDRWIPRLIAVWRRLRKTRGPNHLIPQEVREVAAAISRLSLGLTRERSLVGERYLDDPRLLGAYLLFYWPISYAQARQALGELRERPRTVLDLGSGPAPLAFAALDAGAREVTAADRSGRALEVARALAAEAGMPLATQKFSLGSDPPGKLHSLGDRSGLDLIMMGHVLNELFSKSEDATSQKVELCEASAERLRPRGSLLLIEPALRDTSRQLIRVRDQLVARGYAIRAPCLFRGNCPALVKESDWCHAERNWEMPALTLQLARAAGLHKEALKMSYLIVAPRGEVWAPLPSGQLFRIVSEPLAGKGRRRLIGCGPEGRVGLALQHKHETSNNLAFMELHRGDVIAVSNTEARGDGFALTEASAVQVLSGPGRPFPS